MCDSATNTAGKPARNRKYQPGDRVGQFVLIRPWPGGWHASCPVCGREIKIQPSGTATGPLKWGRCQQCHAAAELETAGADSPAKNHKAQLWPQGMKKRWVARIDEIRLVTALDGHLDRLHLYLPPSKKQDQTTTACGMAMAQDHRLEAVTLLVYSDACQRCLELAQDLFAGGT